MASCYVPDFANLDQTVYCVTREHASGVRSQLVNDEDDSCRYPKVSYCRICTRTSKSVTVACIRMTMLHSSRPLVGRTTYKYRLCALSMHALSAQYMGYIKKPPCQYTCALHLMRPLMYVQSASSIQPF